MAYSDRELLARLVQCEAGGEGDNGMRAVASVVMNRVQTRVGEYGRKANTIRDVIFQPGQFTCAMETVGGQYNRQNIYNMNPTGVHYGIADWAMAGNRLTGLGSALWFFNPYSDSCPKNFPSGVGRFTLRVGEHCFYDPTSAYAST
ncbi:MAG: cell wall hydrolase [Clostridia bacterium]|nr:cell wall hydrolase [Clostridia bacterium]